MSYTPNGIINKSAFLGLLLLVLWSLLSCTRRVTKSNETAIIVSDSSIQRDTGRVIKSDSTGQEQSKSVYKTLTDSSLQAELEIIMQQQKDYANGEGDFNHDSSDQQPVYTDVTIEKNDNSYRINTGGRPIKGIKLKETKQNNRTDSVSVESSKSYEQHRLDSLFASYQAHITDSIARANALKQSDKTGLPWWVWVGCGVVVVGIIAFLFVRKQTKVITKAKDIFS